MNEIEKFKNTINIQTSYNFKLFIPLNIILKTFSNIINSIKSVITFGGYLFLPFPFPTDFSLKDLNLACLSVSGIPEISYEYKSIKFLGATYKQLAGRSETDNEITITFICDNEFSIYRSICLWCDILDFISTYNLNMIYDTTFVSVLSLYKSDCETPSKIFRLWGLRPASKPSIGELNRDNIEDFLKLNVKFYCSLIERTI